MQPVNHIGSSKPPAAAWHTPKGNNEVLPLWRERFGGKPLP